MTTYYVVSSMNRYRYLIDKNMIEENAIVVSTDSDLIQYLEDQGKETIDLWIYLKAEEVEKNWEKTLAVADSWWKYSSLEKYP